jgi:uncharacterized lipoprotein NlpE involved in copper resistance
MKKTLLVALLAITTLLCGCSERQQLKSSLRKALTVAVAHEKAQAEYMLPIEGKIPKSYNGKEVVTATPRDWTSGVFPATMWLLYEHTGDE